MGALKRNWAYVLLALAPLLFLGPLLFSGETLGPFDSVRQMTPWEGPKPTRPWDVLQADAVLQFFGWRDLVFEGWRTGEVPHWNPYQLAGTPLLANSQSGATYPFHILAGVLRLPTGLALVLLAWLHLALAGIGCFALARRLGACEWGGAVSGLGFSLSAFLLSWVALASVPTTLCWIPWTLCGVHDLLAHGEPKSPRAGRGFLLLAVSLAMLLLAGHLQFAAYGVLAIGVFAAGMAVAGLRGPGQRRQAARGLGGLGIAMLLGILIAAPQLLPVLEYSKFSHRRNTPTAEGYQAYAAGAIQPFELLAAVHPTLLGNPALPNPEVPEFSQYWPAFVKRGANFAESAVGFGPLIVGLLFCLRLRRGDVAACSLVAVGGIAALLALGTPLNRLLYFGLPGWSSTGSPGRVFVLCVLAACVLAGLAVSQMRRASPDVSRTRVGLSALAVLFALTFVLAPSMSGSLPRWSTLTGEQIQAMALLSQSEGLRGGFAALVLAGVAIGLLGHKRPFAEFAIVVAAFLSPWLLLGPSFLPSGKPDLTFEGPTDRSQRVAFVNDDWHLLAAADALAPPNTATLSRVRDLGGYDSLLHKETQLLLGEISGGDPAPEANGNIAFVKRTARPEAMAEAGVSEVWSKSPLEGWAEPEIASGSFVKYRVPGPGRASLNGLPAKITFETLNSVTVEAVGPGSLVLRDRAIEGWDVRVGGKPGRLQGGRWLSVELGPGPHIVEFRYVSPRWRFGLAWAAIGLALLEPLRRLLRRLEANPVTPSAESVVK